ncbi:MAG: thioredoxin-dependent thiol peroxidase [Bacteroidetes bacterium]|nr:thioredoxin-dependent thiol peroxidase [Bacteroidota bacterium]
MLKIGEKAPDFKGIVSDGTEIELLKLRGKKVVLYFYPKDSTPGCTVQSCNLRDNYTELIENGFIVLGVSADSQKSHQRFTEKHQLPFPLISDVDKDIIKRYEVWGRKKFMGKEYDGIIRTTFIISETGIIEDIITQVKTKDHTNQIIKKQKL